MRQFYWHEIRRQKPPVRIEAPRTGVLASAWGFLRAYDLVSPHHARGACDIICFGNRFELGTIETPMLYTGKGDGGTTKFFGCDQKRVSKNSSIAEALGSLDELNSFLGLVKVKSLETKANAALKGFASIIEGVQENIFIISANIAGAGKNITEDKVKEVENIIAQCEKELPPIKTFSIAGGAELSTLFDIARTLARRAERRVVAVNDELGKVPPEILKYMNRLSSLLFAFARLTNHLSGIKESAPRYN